VATVKRRKQTERQRNRRTDTDISDVTMRYKPVGETQTDGQTDGKCDAFDGRVWGGHRNNRYSADG